MAGRAEARFKIAVVLGRVVVLEIGIAVDLVEKQDQRLDRVGDQPARWEQQTLCDASGGKRPDVGGNRSRYRRGRR